MDCVHPASTGNLCMLARRRTVHHPTAGSFDLPLLVPSFSSKGFGLHKRHGTKRGDRNRHYCSVAYELEEFGRFPSRAVLVSAYDLHFDHFVAPRMQCKSPLAHLTRAGLVFLDSGGYELAEDFDSSELRRSPYEHKRGYELEHYKSVIQNVISADSTIPLVLTNADWHTKKSDLNGQIVAARELFGLFPGYATNFIIKPGRHRNVLELTELNDTHYSNLSGFDIIGVTEKELGKNLRDRLMKVTLLRRRLDDAGIDVPIHLWGGLDPLLTPLFFFAGAEIFDGISWLRYAFRQGLAINRECGALLDNELGIETPADFAQRMTSMINVRAMGKMEDRLRQWAASKGTDFDMFDKHISAYLNAAYATMQTWDVSPKRGE